MSTEPLKGWAVVQAQGLTFIGRVSHRATQQPVLGKTAGVIGQTPAGSVAVLSPVYEFKPMLTERGVIPMVMPVWLLGITELEVPAGAIVEPIESFTMQQRELLAKFVDQARQAQAQARGEGNPDIVLAPSGSENVVADLLAKARSGR